MSNQTCQECKHYVDGRCRRFPPALAMRPADFCGEWAEAPSKPTRDRLDGLAHAMGCKPEEVSGLVQQHAPWNGRDVCECALMERKAAAQLLRNMGLSLLAEVVERGGHHNLLKENL